MSLRLPSPTTGEMLHAVITCPVFHKMFMSNPGTADDMWHITEQYRDGEDLVLLFREEWHADDYADVASK